MFFKKVFFSIFYHKKLYRKKCNRIAYVCHFLPPPLQAARFKPMTLEWCTNVLVIPAKGNDTTKKIVNLLNIIYIIGKEDKFRKYYISDCIRNDIL